MSEISFEREFGILIAKVDAIHSLIAQDRSQITELDTRLRAVEKLVWRAAGIAGAAGAGGGLLLKFVADLLGGY